MGYSSVREKDRIKIHFQAEKLGDGLIIQIFNENPHIGAVALGEYDDKSKRTSVSILTRKGHKDDIVAQKTAYTISHFSQKATCVIAGVHIENITKDEIAEVIKITEDLTCDYLKAAEN